MPKKQPFQLYSLLSITGKIKYFTIEGTWYIPIGVGSGKFSYNLKELVKNGNRIYKYTPKGGWSSNPSIHQRRGVIMFLQAKKRFHFQSSYVTEISEVEIPKGWNSGNMEATNGVVMQRWEMVEMGIRYRNMDKHLCYAISISSHLVIYWSNLSEEYRNLDWIPITKSCLRFFYFILFLLLCIDEIGDASISVTSLRIFISLL